MKNSEAVAMLLNPLKLLNKDSHISRRYVLRTLRTISKTYIAQRLVERALLNDYNLYSTLECFEFKKEETINCPILSFKRCNILMKSIKPLPELIYSKIGASIKNARTVDDMTVVSLIDLNQYVRNSKRKYKLEDEIYIYIDNDRYVYIPDEEIYALNLELLTLETELLDEKSSCKKSSCKSYWDAEFICPDRLLNPVFTEATRIIAATYGAIIKDSNPNGIEKQATQ